jgi:ribonuclease G
MSTSVEPLFSKKQSPKKLSIGDELIVQVTKEDVKTKAPVVSAAFSLTGKYVVLVHGGKGIQISKKIQQKSVRNLLKNILEPFVTENTGLVVRTNAANASKDELEAELNLLVEEYKHICNNGIHQSKYALLHQELPNYLLQLRDSKTNFLDKVVTNLPAIYNELQAFLNKYPLKTADGSNVKLELTEDANDLVIRYKINHFMDRALHRIIYLNSGATIVIDPTEALTVIDVNTGKAISGKKVTEETFFTINMEAAKEIAAQIKLRNLSGIILIDFINLSDPSKEEALKEMLRNEFKYDSVQTEVVDITKLGLMEITRKKVYKTLKEQLEEAQ